MPGDPNGDISGAAAYEIRIRSELDDTWADWFPGLCCLSRDRGDTVLVGRLDQPALHAVLRRIRDLGLPLISVCLVDAEDPHPDAATVSMEDPQ